MWLPWWITVPVGLMVVVSAGLLLLLSWWITRNGPKVQAQWNAAVQAETDRKVKADA